MAEKDVMKVIQGLQQASANGFDGSGAHDGDGEAKDVGLRRDDGDFLGGHRLIDGFNVKIQGDKLILLYHTEVSRKELHNEGKLKSEIEQRLADALKFLKKEYKNVTGESIRLTKKGSMAMQSESTSKIRSWVRAQCVYKIDGLKEEKEKKRSVDSAIKSWISKGKNDRGY